MVLDEVDGRKETGGEAELRRFLSGMTMGEEGGGGGGGGAGGGS